MDRTTSGGQAVNSGEERGCDSVVKHLLRMQKDPGSILRISG